jgi:hypothetical protein
MNDFFPSDVAKAKATNAKLTDQQAKELVVEKEIQLIRHQAKDTKLSNPVNGLKHSDLLTSAVI